MSPPPPPHLRCLPLQKPHLRDIYAELCGSSSGARRRRGRGGGGTTADAVTVGDAWLQAGRLLMGGQPGAPCLACGTDLTVSDLTRLPRLGWGCQQRPPAAPPRTACSLLHHALLALCPTTHCLLPALCWLAPHTLPAPCLLLDD